MCLWTCQPSIRLGMVVRLEKWGLGIEGVGLQEYLDFGAWGLGLRGLGFTGRDFRLRVLDLGELGDCASGCRVLGLGSIGIKA